MVMSSFHGTVFLSSQFGGLNCPRSRRRPRPREALFIRALESPEASKAIPWCSTLISHVKQTPWGQTADEDDDEYEHD